MIKVKVTVEYNRIADVGEELIQSLDTIVEETAKGVENRANRLMETSPATGLTYKKPDGTDHHASAPYEPPAVYEGELIASSYTKRLGTADYEVGYRDPKAPWLEFGTPRMLPRPFFRPALHMEKIKFYKRVSEAFRIIR
jgi:hypothetical protein